MTQKATRPQEATRIRGHMIGNAHIDPVWLWCWSEGLAETRATFRSALERMKEFEHFKFTSAQAALYKWVELTDPELFEEIKQRVAEGRWELAGGWWVQPDCNLPSGEAFARQALAGQGYFQQHFGKYARCGYNVDSFGHNGMLPQLLKKAGLDYYVFFRPDPHEKFLPAGLFNWQSPDGTRVLAVRPPNHYATWGRKELGENIKRAVEWLPEGISAAPVFYGVGNHGGGPTRENLQGIEELAADTAFPEVFCSTLEAFFEEVEDRAGALPVVPEELLHHSPGCYSAHSAMKKLNRRCEIALVEAEKLAALADLLELRSYPAEALQTAWESVLFNQFHDILAGTSTREAYEGVFASGASALHAAAEARTFAQQAIAARLDTASVEGQALVVFNPQSWTYRGPVEVELPWSGPAELWNDTDEQLPCQLAPQSAKAGGRRKVIFEPDVPPWGWATYWLRKVEVEAEGQAPQATSSLHLENDFLRVELDSTTGTVAKLFDKRTGVELLADSGLAFEVYDDASDTWSHGVERYEDYAGTFEGLEITLEEAGPVRQVVRTVSRWGDSTLTQRLILYAGQPWVELRCALDWHEHFRLLKLACPTALKSPRLTASMPNGHCERLLDGRENPMHKWVDLAGQIQGASAGLSLLNDCKYAYSAENSTVKLTLVRSPAYAWHTPYQIAPKEPAEFLDQGRQDFTLRLLPHAGDWRAAGTVQCAAELNSPPEVVVEASHQGPLPTQEAGFYCSADNIVLGALKRAESGEGLIVRAVESAGRKTKAQLLFPLQEIDFEVEFKPQEIKTFLLKDGQAIETDLLERPLEGGKNG